MLFFLVSVSLRSIIHSYAIYDIANDTSLYLSFRLLTEYHSFLWKDLWSLMIYGITCFRLLTEYHSFLLQNYLELQTDIFGVSVSLRSIIHSYKRKKMRYCIEKQWKFPSPYGVSFILIIKNLLKKFFLRINYTFPSPYGVSFILI